MTITVTCPICRTRWHVTSTTGSGLDYCSIACYRTAHGQPQLTVPATKTPIPPTPPEAAA
jgi:hypothetical protein